MKTLSLTRKYRENIITGYEMWNIKKPIHTHKKISLVYAAILLLFNCSTRYSVSAIMIKIVDNVNENTGQSLKGPCVIAVIVNAIALIMINTFAIAMRV